MTDVITVEENEDLKQNAKKTIVLLKDLWEDDATVTGVMNG